MQPKPTQLAARNHTKTKGTRNMKTNRNSIQILTAAALLLMLSGALSDVAIGAVITDPATVSGQGSIDPSGSVQDVDTAYPASGAGSIAGLEGRSDLSVVQNWNDGTNSFADIDGVNDTSNIIDFSDNKARPDVRFTFTGDFLDDSGDGGPGTGAETDIDNNHTSTDSGIRVKFDGAGTVVVRIDFGLYNSGTESFDSNVLSIDAAGFTLSNLQSGTSGTVSFFTNADSSLGSQSYTGGDTGDSTDNGYDFYFGLDRQGAFDLGYLEISMTASSAKGQGIDDLAITATTIPEPGALALLAVGLACSLGRRPRRTQYQG